MKREYPVAPIVAVGAVILDGDRILLIRRDREPARGRWSFPGGAVELGESLEEAVMREALEETGLRVSVGEVATVIDRVERNEDGRVRYHYVIVDFFARAVGGTLRPASDVSDARWVGLEELDRLELTEKAGALARRLLQKRAASENYGF
jgi:ADP-ribose pyrophosphatase YjhB (NUDIX family)